MPYPAPSMNAEKLQRYLEAAGAVNTTQLVELKDGWPRKFNMNLLNSHDWLIIGDAGGFCLYCKLFLTSTTGPRKPGKFIAKPYTSYNRPKDLVDHETTKYHRDAATAAHNLLAVARGRVGSIRACIDKKSRDDEEINSRRRCSIVKTLVLCARQEIPLRGHSNESVPFQEPSEHIIRGDVNRGNFLQMLQYRMDAGDTVIAQSTSQRT